MFTTAYTTFKSFHTSLAFGVAITLMMVASAVAQEAATGARGARQEVRDENGNLAAATDTTPTTKRVIVTGSNIPTAEEVGPNPVLTLTRDTIEKSGDHTTEQFLRDLPIANANGVPISNNENGSNTAV